MLSSLCSETPVMLLAYSCLTTLWKQRRHLQNSFLNSFGCSFWVLKWPKRLVVKKPWHNFSVPNCNTGGRLGSWKMKPYTWCRAWKWGSDCGIQEVLVGKHLWRLLVQWLAQIKVVTSTRSSQLHFFAAKHGKPLTMHIYHPSLNYSKAAPPSPVQFYFPDVEFPKLQPVPIAPCYSVCHC